MEIWQIIVLVFIAGVASGWLLFEYGFDARISDLKNQYAQLQTAHNKVIVDYRQCVKGKELITESDVGI